MNYVNDSQLIISISLENPSTSAQQASQEESQFNQQRAKYGKLLIKSLTFTNWHVTISE